MIFTVFKMKKKGGEMDFIRMRTKLGSLSMCWLVCFVEVFYKIPSPMNFYYFKVNSGGGRGRGGGFKPMPNPMNPLKLKDFSFSQIRDG